jgi:transposase InsO family protein
MVGPAVNREAVAHLRSAFQMSERRACSIIATDRIDEIAQPAAQLGIRRPAGPISDRGARFGYRRLFVRIEWHYIAPGKPMQSGFCESFDGRMRDER